MSKLSMKPLIIFDMDGVLIDSEPIHLQLEQALFRTLGLALSATEHERFVGMSPQRMWSEIRERFGLKQPVAELVTMDSRAKVRAFERMTLSPVAGVQELIRSIAREGYGLAIASSSSRALIDIIVAGLGFDRYFPHRLSGEDVEKGKPDPDLFLTVAQHCGRTPGQCVVVEDSSNGVRAAITAGMKCIAYRNRSSGEQDLSGADLVVERFGDSEIRRIVKFLKESPRGL